MEPIIEEINESPTSPLTWIIIVIVAIIVGFHFGKKVFSNHQEYSYNIEGIMNKKDDQKDE